jgi:hypothetical protein
MDTLQTKAKNSNNKFFEILSYIIIAIGLLGAFIGISEFYNVKLGGLESAYPFGAGDNAEDWLYKTASHYSNYMLVSGLLFLAASVIALVGKIKRKRKMVTISVCIVLLLFFIGRAI